MHPYTSAVAAHRMLVVGYRLPPTEKRAHLFIMGLTCRLLGSRLIVNKWALYIACKPACTAATDVGMHGLLASQ